MLRDRLVCGTCSRAIQHRLLQETALTFNKALEIALSAEAADKDSKRLTGVGTDKDLPTTQIGHVNDRPLESPPQQVYNHLLGVGKSNVVLGRGSVTDVEVNMTLQPANSSSTTAICGRGGLCTGGIRYVPHRLWSSEPLLCICYCQRQPDLDGNQHRSVGIA